MSSKIYFQNYQKSPHGKKVRLIGQWKRRGLISDDYEKIHNIYLSSTNCNICNIIFDETNNNNKKIMDHNHNNGEYRQIICRQCNLNNYSLNKHTKTYDRGIQYYKLKNTWRYEKGINNKKYCSKSFKTKIEALCYKFIFLKFLYPKN